MPSTPFNRREFLKLTATTIAANAIMRPFSTRATPASRIKAIAFDAFAIFDPRPIFARAEDFFPGRGTELSNLWRARQFEYTWLRCMLGKYADFWQITEDALVFATKALKLKLSHQARAQLMAGYLELKAWPDASAVLLAIEQANIRMALLSNFTPEMLRAAVKSSRSERAFEHLLSTDALRTYKPDPRAYQMAVDVLKLEREQIGFVAFAAWDAAWARSFGFPTFWVNRQNAPAEELGLDPDASSATLDGLTEFVGISR